MDSDECFACRHCDNLPMIYQIGHSYEAACACGHTVRGDTRSDAIENWNEENVSRMPPTLLWVALICIGLAALFG